MIRTIALKALAGTAVLTLGLGTAASAATPTTPTATPAKSCKGADARVERLHQREAKLDARLVVLRARDAKAKANGHDDRAQRIEKRIDRDQKASAAAAARIAKIRDRCPATATPAS